MTALAMNVDVTDRDRLEPAFLRFERDLGEVDILVNDACHANLSGGVLLENAADWDRVRNAVERVFLLSKLQGGIVAEGGGPGRRQLEPLDELAASNRGAEAGGANLLTCQQGARRGDRLP